jgi:undecaprenyl-phosphate 4-deoxy-4-formamido-L-arabinose transferase
VRILVPTLSVVVPVYRSEESLDELYRRLVATLAAESAAFEIIFVEDAGGDGSWELIGELAARDPRVRGLRMSRNFGQHSALLCGIRAARNEVVVTLDDDLQNPPEEIPKLLAELANGFDVVYGVPEQGQHGFYRNLASWITKLALQSAMGAETAGKSSAFRVFRTKLRESFRDYRNPFVNVDVLLSWGTTRFSSVTVKHDARRTGSSGYTFYKLMAHALNMMTGFSTMPLQIASVMGFVFSLFGGLVLAWVLGRFLLQGNPVQGFPFLASIIAIFSGVQLFTIGIIGEYLARAHFRMMERPPFVIDERVNEPQI